MISSKNIEKLEHSAVKLSLVVPQEDVKKIYDTMIAEYGRTVHIDGFRAGHVPAAVLLRKFGEELKIEAMGRVLEKAVEEAVADIEEKPLVYATPSLEGEPEFDPGKDFAFAVTYDTFPNVEVTDWKGLELELPVVGISSEDEDRELAQLRERNAIVVEKDGSAAAAKGDVVTVDYRELDAEAATIEGSERQDFTFELGTGYNIYKFDDELAGMKKDEERIFEKSFPEDYEDKDLAGRTVKIAVRLAKIKEKKLPDLDDDFAQDISEKYTTLEDLKADLRARLEKNLSDKLRQVREQAIVDRLLVRTTVDLPRSMVDAELAMRLDSLKRQMKIDSDENLERFLSYSGKSRGELLEQWRPSAEKSITTRLVLEKLAEEGKYECGAEELEAEYERQAKENSLSVDEIKAEYERRGSVDYLKDRIKEDKLMDAIFAEAKVKQGKKMSFMDLFKDNE
ncbi:MAG: trigger factor [Treponema sp.]|nr:trigger factor [Treponema sp.]